MIHDTETIDRLFLELSQFTKATTARELAAESVIDAVYALGAGPIEQAKQIPLAQWVKTRFIRIDGACGHNEIVDRLNNRVGELESELALSLRCDECGGLRTLHPSRNFYECLPCHQKRIEP